MNTPDRDSPEKPADDVVNTTAPSILAYLSLLLPFAALALLAVGLVFPTAAEQLLLGWIYFPFRVLPQITVDWLSVLLCAVSTVAFVFGLHRMRLWLAREQIASAPAIVLPIRFRTTCALALLVLLAFAAGTAIVGASHQLIWLATDRPPRTSEENGAPIFGVLSKARMQVERQQQKSNLRQVGLGIHNFHDTIGSLPPGGTVDEHGWLLHGWAILAGPYIGHSYEGIDFAVPWNQPPNDRLYRCALEIYLNPSVAEVFDAQGFGLSHVSGNANVLPIVRAYRNAGSDGLFGFVQKAGEVALPFGDRPTRLDDISDGLSHTLLIGEAADNYRPWGHPANVRDPELGLGASRDGFGGAPGTEGALFIMCDGSLRFISHQVDSNVFRALGTPAGGETIDLENGN